MNKIFLITILLSYVFISCEDEIITPTEKIYGIQGTILDTSGNELNGVKVYCLFNYSYVPLESSIPLSALNNSDSVFTNQLYQNFPNPVFNETFVRFSVDSKSTISLELKSNIDNNIYYSYKDTLDYGLYQHYLGDLAQNTQLKNGIYSYKLKSNSFTGNEFEDNKELILVGTENKPNSISDKYGKYTFNSEEAFIGDTIKVCNEYDPSNIYDKIIDDYIFLLFKKEGYHDKIIGVYMYPDVIYTQDIVLEGESNK